MTMPSDPKPDDAHSRLDLEEILRDLREANANLVLANLRSLALADEVRALYKQVVGQDAPLGV